MFNDPTLSISNTSEVCYCVENDELFPLLYTLKEWLAINSLLKSHIISTGAASSARITRENAGMSKKTGAFSRNHGRLVKNTSPLY